MARCEDFAFLHPFFYRKKEDFELKLSPAKRFLCISISSTVHAAQCQSAIDLQRTSCAESFMRTAASFWLTNSLINVLRISVYTF